MSNEYDNLKERKKYQMYERVRSPSPTADSLFAQPQLNGAKECFFYEEPTYLGGSNLGQPGLRYTHCHRARVTATQRVGDILGYVRISVSH